MINIRGSPAGNALTVTNRPRFKTNIAEISLINDCSALVVAKKNKNFQQKNSQCPNTRLVQFSNGPKLL
jgi:hypothetical protein